MNENYWGNFPDADLIPTPVSVLKAQAVALRTATKSKLLAEVESGRAQDGDLQHRFVVLVPALNNYRYELFTIEHPVTLAPIYLNSDHLPNIIKCVDMEGFEKYLKQFLSSKEVRAVIMGLLAQSV